jgi:hypothetical protein
VPWLFRADAEDAETLDRVKDVTGRHLERFGAKGGLVVAPATRQPSRINDHERPDQPLRLTYPQDYPAPPAEDRAAKDWPESRGSGYTALTSSLGDDLAYWGAGR